MEILVPSIKKKKKKKVVEWNWRGMSLLAVLWSAFHHSKMFSCDSVAIERPRPPRLLNIWRNAFPLQIGWWKRIHFEWLPGTRGLNFSLDALGHGACAAVIESCCPSIDV